MSRRKTSKTKKVRPNYADMADEMVEEARRLDAVSKQAEVVKRWVDEAEIRVLTGTLPPTVRLPTTAEERKSIPLAAVLDYFPDACCDVAKVIKQGQVQHSTDRWDRSKSTDHADCLQRHFLERGTKDVDGLRHSAKMVWRALALLQLELEAELGLPPSRGSK